MTRFSRNDHGKYVVQGKTYEMLIGTRAQVWHTTAYKTSGGLTKSDLFQNKAGRIVSKCKYLSAKKDKRLIKAGYGTKKGKFGFVKIGKSAKRGGGSRKRKSQKGGLQALNPTPYDGKNVGTSGVNLQFVAGNATS